MSSPSGASFSLRCLIYKVHAVPGGTLLLYSISFRLSRTFLTFFIFFLLSVPEVFLPHKSALIGYHIRILLSRTFLFFFQSFQCVLSHLESNGEGGIWTLAPLLTTYSLSRGAPSTTWVLLLGWSFNLYSVQDKSQCLSQAERVGFEPTRPFGQTVFKTASLWPLRYLSKLPVISQVKLSCSPSRQCVF